MTEQLEAIAIVGPTASGKTELSVALAQACNGEIINGDSMQVYKELNIGTAKIKPDEMGGVPHHFFDVKEPTESFSVAEYQKGVRDWIEQINQRGKLPIIVGGTGLYVQSVLFDYRFTEEASDPEIRGRLEKQLAEEGASVLFERLQTLDPKSAEAIHPNNHRRLIRALEILEVTGRTKQQHEQNLGNLPVYNHVIIGLDLPREQLYERINQRVDIMVEEGLFEEVRGLWDRGIREAQSVQAIGYKEIYRYFAGELSRHEAIELIKKNTRNYAKRQLTYFRNKLDIQWIDANLPTEEKLSRTFKIIEDFK